MIVDNIFKVKIAPVQTTIAKPVKVSPSGSSKPGRNDPCPCGKINPKTGKPMKYKKCCYPKFG